VSDNLRRYTVAIFELDRVVHAVPEDAWDEPSPCEGWTAREVAGHAMGVVANVAAKLGARDAVNAFGDVAGIAGRDPAATYRHIRDEVLEALDHDEALAAPVQSALGMMSMDEYLGALVGDALIHAWDIARATGVDERLDPDLVEYVLARMTAHPVARSAGRFGDEVAPAEGATPQERLLALSGRQP
jgi:uncharacterized protein (TIGR03086 family)